MLLVTVIIFTVLNDEVDVAPRSVCKLNAASVHQRRAKIGEIPNHLIMYRVN